MKNILKFLFLSFILAGTFTACTKDEVKDYYAGGTNPVLSASTNAISLSYANAALNAITFAWTNPNYQFTTGISSQNVNYLLEIDTTGANFTNPNRQTISVSKDLGLSITVGTLNDYLLNQLRLKDGMVHNLDVRITATLINSSAPLYSNVLKVTATPYAIPAKITPPASGTLFIVGSSVPVSGWNNPIVGTSQIALQQFKQVSTTLYSITIALVGGGSYQFVPTNGSWNGQMGIAVKNDPAEVNGGDFVASGSNDILGPTADGTYKIDVDFQRGKFTVTKQ